MKFVKINYNWLEVVAESGIGGIARDEYNRLQEYYVEDAESAEADSLHDLDWSNTILYNNEFYKTGWLSPGGEFFGCDDNCHHKQAEHVHNKSEFSLDQEGWVRISYYYTKNIHVMFDFKHNTRIPTAKQLRFLKGEKYDMEKLLNTCREVRATLGKNLVLNNEAVEASQKQTPPTSQTSTCPGA
jgi:hypothetical protein